MVKQRRIFAFMGWESSVLFSFILIQLDLWKSSNNAPMKQSSDYQSIISMIFMTKFAWQTQLTADDRLDDAIMNGLQLIRLFREQRVDNRRFESVNSITTFDPIFTQITSSEAANN